MSNNARARVAAGVKKLPAAVFNWMDGSLFFTAVFKALDFLKYLCAGSYIVGLFTADYDDERARGGLFARLCERALNAFPKILTAPKQLPAFLSNILGGSALISAVCDGIGAPVPPPGKAAGFGAGLLAVIQWCVSAAPGGLLLLAAAGAPFLPTMALAGLLAAAAVLALFRFRFETGLTQIVLIFFILISLFCGFTSFEPSSASRVALLTSAFMFSAVLIPACCVKREQADFYVFAFLTAGAGTGLYGLYQFVTLKAEYAWLDKELFSDIGLRVFSTFENPNVYGTYLLLVIPLAAAVFFYTKNIWYKLYALGVGGLLTLNLLLSYSRGCYLALGAAAVLFVFLVERRLAVLAAPSVLALPLVMPATMLNRLLSIANLNDSSTASRISIWQSSLRIIKNFWMAGLGQGGDAFNTVLPKYSFNAVVAQHAHNLYMQIMAETGLIGFIVFLGVLACFIRSQAVSLRRAGGWRDRLIPAAFISGAAGLLCQGMFDHAFYNYRVLLLFYVLMGIGLAFARLTKTADAA